MNTNIDKRAKINDVAHGSFQNHPRRQVFDLKHIAAQNRLWHVLSRVSRRLLQLLDNVLQRHLSHTQFFREFFVVMDLFGNALYLPLFYVR